MTGKNHLIKGEKMKVRIKFRKYGAMIFIGHLDIMRYFQKAIRRADIDIAYSQGFNPHQIMSFAAPLGVGLYSDGEYLDIECNSVTNSEDMRDRLNQVMVEGIDIVNVRMLPECVGNAMASVSAAEYEVKMRYDDIPNIDYKSQLQAFFAQDEIIVRKQTKKSEKELDIKPFIFSLDCVIENVKPVYHMIVDASSAGNIKPGLVLSAFYQFLGLALGDFDLVVKRCDTLTNIGSVDKPHFVGLDKVGEVIE